MKTVLSNYKNRMEVKDLISLASKYSSEVEVFLDFNELTNLNPALHSNILNEFISLFKKFNVKLAGICIETGFNTQEYSLMAKSAVQLLRSFNGGYVRLMPGNGEQFDADRLVWFLNQIARFAAFRTGGGEGEGPVVIVHAPPKGCKAKELCRMYKSINYKCTALALHEADYAGDDLKEIIDHFNQSEFSLFCSEVDEDISEERLADFCSSVTKAYDGRLIIQLNDGKKLNKIQAVAEKYNFDTSHYDYSKSSCPSSVSRIIKDLGSATLIPSDDVIACQDITWKYEWKVGNCGIKTGGGIKIEFNHATNMEMIQLVNPKGRGYTTVSGPDGVKLKSSVFHEDACVTLGIIVEDGELKSGDIITVIFGDDSKGAPKLRVQTYQCNSFMFYSFVDPTGYGVYFAQRSQPSIKILGDKPDRLKVFAPSNVKAGENFDVKLRVEDAYNNVATGFSGKFEVHLNGKQIKEFNIESINGNPALQTISGISISSVGNYFITVKSGDLTADSNYIAVTETGYDDNGYQLYFGDIHGHVSIMDGFGSIDEYYEFAKDVAFLDFTCHSDHMDSYSGNRQSSNDVQWELIKEGVRKHHIPGKFVTLLGFENSDEFGDANTYFKTDDAPWRSCSMINDLFSFAKKHDAIVIPHMTSYAQRGRGYDWMNYDKEIVPAIEIYSCHGSSEFFGGEYPLHFCEPGGFAHDALALGRKIGFIGSGDGHECMPGNATFGSRINGLVGVFVKELTREAIIDAIKARRCFATNNRRCIAKFSINNTFMGGELEVKHGENLNINACIYAQSEIEEAFICKDGKFNKAGNINGRICTISHNESAELGSHYYYIKVKQKDGGIIWLSPIFLEGK